MKKILVLILSILLVTGCSTTMEKSLNKVKINIDTPDDIKITCNKDYSKYNVACEIKNTTSKTLKYNFDIKLLGKDKKSLKSTKYTYEYVDANSTTVRYFPITTLDDNNEETAPSTVSIKLDYEEEDYKLKNDLITADYKIEYNNLTYTVTSSKKVSFVDLMIVLYKDNEIVYVKEKIHQDLKKDTKDGGEIELPEDLTYDNVRIIVNEAY